MTDLWTRIPPQHPLPLNYAQGQKFGIAVAADGVLPHRHAAGKRTGGQRCLPALQPPDASAI